MVSVTEALDVMLRDLAALPPERVSLLEARGRVLAEAICAPRDLPPRDNSAMDGYALCLAQGARAAGWHVVESIPAGGEGSRPLAVGEAAKIMTGAPVPAGADTVVPVEDTHRTGEFVEVVRLPTVGAHIRPAGEDVREGQLVIPPGTVVRPAEVGMLASVGRSFVAVYQRPRVAVLATGDEIVDIDAPTTGGRIINSNSYGVAAQIAEAGGVPVVLGIGRDDPEGLLALLRQAGNADAVVTTGGVSMGDYDYVRPVLEQAGVTVCFWQVAMKPGKPFVFGRAGRVPVFGLPGNPVSAMVVFEEFVRPALRVMQGHGRPFRPVLEATLLPEAGALRTSAGRTHFVRCRVERRGAELVVVSLKSQGSGILRTLVEANGLLVVPPEARGAQPGDRVRVQLYDTGFLEGEAPGLPGTAGP